MSEQIDGRRESPWSIDRLMQLVPARWRRGAAVVPVVRLSGVIGAVTPLRPGRPTAFSCARVWPFTVTCE